MFRKHARTSMRCSIVLEHKEAGAIEVFTHDVSATGMFVRTPQPGGRPLAQRLRIGDVLMARLESPDNVGEPLQLQVTRLTSDGVGLVFV